MNKFTITELPETKSDKPVLYKIHFGNKGKYYLHKGKILKDSVDRFLDDVFRGIRDKGFPETYSNVVAYCKQFPAVNKVSVEVVFNGEPSALLKKESAFYKSNKSDEDCLNRFDIEPYKPEWMIKQSLQKRCDNEACIKSGIINGKTTKFKFCPNCGRLNK